MARWPVAIRRKWKIESKDGGIAESTPLGQRRGPLEISVDQWPKKRGQLIGGHRFDQFQCVTGVQMVVGQPDGHGLEVPGLGKQVCVNLGLAPMAGIGSLFNGL